MPTPVWLDCDPGHDDAIALLWALHSPEIDLVGISTVHGNASLDNTSLNAARCLLSYGSPEQTAPIKIYTGVARPLLRPVKHDAEIHGSDGLGGVEGLLSADDPRVRAKLAESQGQNAIIALADAAQTLPEGQQLAIVATGALTNIALFVTMYPELVRDKVSQIVLMGGAEGIRGNRSPTAEFNILIDPHAASIVFDAEVKVVMTPLNVTHQALFRNHDHANLLVPPSASTSSKNTSTAAHTPLRHSLSTLLNFFAETYATVFNFQEGPPVHDPLCIAYIAEPSLFKGKRYRVDVELEGKWTAGTTSVDIYGYRDQELTAYKEDENSRESWGPKGKNVFVLEELDVKAFWDRFHEIVELADKVSVLNGH
ncbi:hypothetical protein JCM5353_001733 [Sporobolomyces roseus]